MRGVGPPGHDGGGHGHDGPVPVLILLMRLNDDYQTAKCHGARHKAKITIGIDIWRMPASFSFSV